MLKNAYWPTTVLALASLACGAQLHAAPASNTPSAVKVIPASATTPTAKPAPRPVHAVGKPVAPVLPALTAAQIVDRNVAARGGLAAWQAAKAISWKGTMGAGGRTYMTVTDKAKLEQKEREEMQLPFRFEFKRPLKSRLELDFNGQTAVQVFDGTHGWKLRPFLGRNNWDAFTADELKQASMEPGMDGWLIDYAARGAKVVAAGTELVEDHAAYKLKVTRKDGQVRYVWVDGQSFLDIKTDGEPRKLDGRPHSVAVMLRDFRNDQGLMIPHVQETVVDGVPKSEKVTIESVTVNPVLDDSRFTKGK
jgi:outer membrane lipoprotein-sorting protein